jgi:DMSO/TMAO reductase YedYZ molybdopterin-dependent catalytic subunit
MKLTVLVCALNLTILSTTVFSQSDSTPVITVEGEVVKKLKLTTNDISKFPQTEVIATDKDGGEHRFRGTLLSVILDSAGVSLGKQLRGENLMKYVLIKAADSYQVVYSLPEIDPEFTSHQVVLATHIDGGPLPKGEGPFRLITPQDKRPTRWIRDVTTIKILISKDD